MAVHKIKGRWFFHCDECGESALGDVHTDFIDFFDALADIIEAGWQTEQRIDSTPREDKLYWHHRCWRCCNDIWP